jgi:hypothetical protein
MRANQTHKEALPAARQGQKIDGYGHIMIRNFTNLRSKKNREQTIERILSLGPTAQPPTYISSIKISQKHWEIAHNAGSARKAIKDLRGRQPGESRTSDVETESVLTEFLISMLLDGSGAQTTPLVAYKPDPALDVNLGGVTFDIKCVRSCAKCIAVNADAHAKKCPSFYLFVRVIDGHTIDLYVSSAGAVSAWPVRTTYRGLEMPTRKWYRATDLPPPLQSADCCTPV